MKKNQIYLLALSLFFSAAFGLKAKASESDTLHLHDSNSFKGFELLDSIVGDYDVFINGENHTFLDANSKLWVKMFKYLHKTAGVRNIMIEYGYASGWLINEYLQTGDTALYSVIKTYAYDQYAEAYKELMEYNQTLDSNDKIYLTGIDLERGVYSASKILSMQFPETSEPHDSIALHVESLKSLVSFNEIKVFDPESDYNYYTSYSVQNTIDNIILNFDAHEVHYRDYLGEKFELFKRILLGIKDLKVYYQYNRENSTHQFVYRERYMYNQFKKEYKAKGGKFFGQFGRCHIAKNTQTENSCNWYNFKSLANRIEQSGATGKDSLKVFTTGIFYHTDTHNEDEMDGMQGHMDELFADMEDNRLRLYNLPNDSALHSRLESMFDYIVLCTYKSNREYGASVQDIEDLMLTEDNTRIFLLFSGGVHQINMDPLNSYLGVGDEGFTSYTPFWSITMGTKESEFGLHSLGYIGGYLKQNVEISDTVSARLSGFVYKSLSGYDFFKNQDWVDFLAGFGFSYHNLKLDVTKTTDNPDVVLGYIGEQSIARVKNPAIILDFFSSLEFNIDNFTIGGTVGYGLDLSQSNWRAEKRLLADSPSTSMDGIFGSVNIGFNFGAFD